MSLCEMLSDDGDDAGADSTSQSRIQDFSSFTILKKELLAVASDSLQLTHARILGRHIAGLPKG